jgi:competence protein ComEA
MPEGISRSQLAAYAAVALAVALLGVRYLRSSGSSEPLPAAAPVRLESADGGRAAVLVHVAGEVRRPGVYRLRAGSRIADAVRRAGGATARADLSAVNLAAKAEDGRQVLVPRRAPPGGAAAGAAPPSAAPGGPAAGPPAQPVNLNTATLEQLDTLDGIGPGLAQAILEFREENGGFGSVEELGQVPGIGEKRLASLREQVTV